jgi:4-hydroxy-2-oxoheptanedioate aldolase
MGRDVGVVFGGASPALVKALDDAVIAIMVEKKQCVENLETILSVKGIDMVQFGPADYSMSIGVAGQRDNPAIREAEEYVIKTALKMGVHPRAEIREPKMAERYLNLGVRHFCMAWDVSILFNWWKENGPVLRDMMKGL